MVNSKPLKVLLLVASSPNFLKQLAIILNEKMDSYQLRIANNGREALDILGKHPIAGIICAKSLPEMDGLELLGKIRENDAWKELPVLMLFERLDKESVVQAIQAGVTELLAKPFGPKDLVAKVRKMFVQAERRGSIRYNVSASPEVIVSTAVIVSNGDSVCTSGEIVDFSSGGVLTQLTCSSKLNIYCQVELRLVFTLAASEQLAESMQGQLIRIEKPPGPITEGKALYAFVFKGMRPNHRTFMQNLIHRLKTDVADDIV